MAAISQLTYKHIGDGVLVQPFNNVETTQYQQLGTRARGFNATDGVCEFVYVQGVASCALGDWVTINTDDWSITRIVPNAIGPVGVAMGAIVASSYGWVCVKGKIDARAADVADNGKVYIDTVAGNCDDAVVAGDKVHNAKWASADDTGVTSLGWAEVEIWDPFVTDEST